MEYFLSRESRSFGNQVFTLSLSCDVEGKFNITGTCQTILYEATLPRTLKHVTSCVLMLPFLIVNH